MILLIYGTGGAAKEIFDLATAINSATPLWENIAFVDQASVTKKHLLGLPVYTLAEVKNLFSLTQCQLVIAIGDPDIRTKVMTETMSFPKATLIHPTAVVSPHAILGEGTIVSAFAYVGSESTLGEHCLIQHHSVVSHDCTFGNNVVFSAHGFVGGGATIGENAFIGAGAMIRENRNIGTHSIVGMGAVVPKSVGENCIAYGNPLQIRKREPGKRIFE